MKDQKEDDGMPTDEDLLEEVAFYAKCLKTALADLMVRYAKQGDKDRCNAYQAMAVSADAIKGTNHLWQFEEQ